MNKASLTRTWDDFRTVHGIGLRAIESIPEAKLEAHPIPNMRSPKGLVCHMYQIIPDLTVTENIQLAMIAKGERRRPVPDLIFEYFPQLRPLLALASKHVEFYILALKLNDTRIFKCTDQFCEAAKFPKDAGTEAAGFVPGASQSFVLTIKVDWPPLT